MCLSPLSPCLGPSLEGNNWRGSAKAVAYVLTSSFNTHPHTSSKTQRWPERLKLKDSLYFKALAAEQLFQGNEFTPSCCGNRTGTNSRRQKNTRKTEATQKRAKEYVRESPCPQPAKTSFSLKQSFRIKNTHFKKKNCVSRVKD